MTFEKLKDIALVTPGTSPKGELINSSGLGLPFFQGSKEFTELYPVPERYTEHPVKVARSGDVLISVRAPVGEVNIAREDCAIGRGVMSVRAKKKSEQLFIFYFLKGLQGKWDSLGSTGSVFENLSTVALNNVVIRDGLRREVIGEILFNIDQRIASNKAISKALEDIARTLFKSWFIDFDPVKAKIARVKPVGIDAETSALFPDSMKESELGLIPNGWVVSSLDEISEYLNGLAMQKFPVTDEKVQLPVIKIAQLRAGNVKGADMASGLLDSRFIINDGDILFSWSGTLEVETWAGGPGALNQHLFKVTGKKVPDWFSYLSTKHFLAFFREVASSKATTMGHIQRGHLSESKLAIPNLEMLNRATEVIEPLISRKIEASIESRNLAEIRDSLLTRLISGQLQIPDEMLAS